MTRMRQLLANRHHGDEGFTLIEMLIGLLLTSLVTSMVFTAVMAASRVATSSRRVNDLNEEARIVMNRMSRELREAKAVTAVSNPAGPGGATMDATADVSVTFEVDFNGNGVIEPDAGDPEVLTYIYDRSAQRLVLQAAGQSLPVLAANVSDFTLDFTTRRYQYDGVQFTTGSGCTSVNQVRDGVVHWYEVDKYPASVGNCDGELDAELPVIDSVQIDLKVLYGPQQQVYRTTVDMRNSAG
jgi:prepilin-type N-terminal cleavage/methylation domain-containing protein